MKLPLLGKLFCLLSAPASAGTAVDHATTIKAANDASTALSELDSPTKGSPRRNESGQFSIHLKKPGGMAAYMALPQAKQQGLCRIGGRHEQLR